MKFSTGYPSKLTSIVEFGLEVIISETVVFIKFIDPLIFLFIFEFGEILLFCTVFGAFILLSKTELLKESIYLFTFVCLFTY